ncbi:MAG: hypothetical protein R3F65_06420 [bacterium]
MSTPPRREAQDVEPAVHVEAVRERLDQLIDEIDGRLRKLGAGDAHALLDRARQTLGEVKASLEAFAPPSPAEKARIKETLDDAGAHGPAAGGGHPA